MTCDTGGKEEGEEAYIKRGSNICAHEERGRWFGACGARGKEAGQEVYIR